MHEPHAKRWIALAILGIVLASLLFPAFEGLSFAGFFGDKTYLVILQDNSEIRGTGGLMSVMGTLTLHNGHIADIHYYYSHTSQELRTNVSLDGPESFTSFFDVDTARLYDSNNEYNFASFAPTMESDWYNVTGQKVDGVIGLDFTAVEAILRITGPITVAGDIITSRNVFHRLEYYSASSSQNGTRMADILAKLTYGTLGLIVDASVPQKLALYNTLGGLANERHLFIYPTIEPLLQQPDGRSRAPEADFISVVDTNVGNGKSDFGIERAIDYSVQLLPDGSAVSNLTLTYTNLGWWDSDLFAEVLVPPGAQLLATHSSTNLFGPQITNGDGFTAISSKFNLQPYTTTRITYLYTLPDRVFESGIASHYDLYVIKQGGIDRFVLNASVQLPAGAKLIHSENIGSNMFTKDAHVSVIYRL